MSNIILARTKKDFEIIEYLANIIWNEHYIPIIGKQQVDYMLDKFQSAAVMADQVSNGVKYYLIEHDNNMMGYFSYCIRNDHLFLSKLYVLSSARGNGLGRMAMNYLYDKTKKSGLEKIQLTVNKYNTNSIKAYEKMGFISVDDIIQDIGNGFVMDDFVLVKVID